MATIEVGQNSTAVNTVEDALKTDGAKVLEAQLATALPWTRLPFISFFVDMIIEHVVDLFVTKVDQAAFAIYVAVNTGKQVSDYVQAQAAGDTNEIDKAGDALIHLGD